MAPPGMWHWLGNKSAYKHQHPVLLYQCNNNARLYSTECEWAVRRASCLTIFSGDEATSERKYQG